jgi:hypothetical protein
LMIGRVKGKPIHVKAGANFSAPAKTPSHMTISKRLIRCRRLKCFKIDRETCGIRMTDASV